jgi:hypothetical protein
MVSLATFEPRQRHFLVFVFLQVEHVCKTWEQFDTFERSLGSRQSLRRPVVFFRVPAICAA